jgi:pSer/pThr/pTyr-binding forkhead associated (FHA) protein
MLKLQFKDKPEKSLWLVGDKLTLGSAEGNDVVLKGLGINEQHAEIVIEGTRLILKSAAGSCFINNRSVDSDYELKVNDELRIGKERLLVIDPQKAKQQPAADRDNVPATTDSAASAWKLITDHPKLHTQDFSITQRAIVGRSKSCDISIPYKLLSREHAVFTVANGELILEDLNSANGCFVNGERVERAVLAEGDQVALAKLLFTVRGPVLSSPLALKNTSQELNKTIIRPAINVQESLQQPQLIEDNKPSLLLEQEANIETPAPIIDNPAPRSVGWIWIICLTISLVALAYYFS